MTGYMVLAVFAFVFISLAYFVSKKFPSEGVDDFVVAGRSMPFGIIAASVTVSWIWTTSLMGAAESGFWYGIGGGVAYALGSFVPFFVFIPLILRLRRIMPRCTTFVEFVEQRYDATLQKVFLLFAIGVALYISFEQMMGIGYAISQAFDIPYKVVVICVTAIITLYISLAGLRGSVINDLIQFFGISIVCFVLVPIVLTRFGMTNLYDGLKDVAINPLNPNHNTYALSIFNPPTIRYLLINLVICMGYVLLDQGYYSKALSTYSTKSLLAAYLIGTIVAWAPIPVLFGNIFGGIGLSMGLVPGEGVLNVSTEVAPFVFGQAFPTYGGLIFSLVIFMAGMTTAGNALSGLQALMIVDLQQKILKRQTSEKDQTRFGKRATLVFGGVVMTISLLVEGQSLLQLDIMSGIVFATPIAAFLMGMYWSKPSAKLALSSIIIGLIGGVTSYILIQDPDLDYFVGNIVSLLLPAVILVVGSLFSKHHFDFIKLAEYHPTHEVHSYDGGATE